MRKLDVAPNPLSGKLKNCYGLLPVAIWWRKVAFAGLLLCIAAVAGCTKSKSGDAEKAFSLADYLCVLTPSACNGAFYRKVYLAPPDAVYEITLNGKNLKVPMGYLSPLQSLTDPRNPSLSMEVLLPDLTPHGPQNLREFFMPYDRSKASIGIDHRPAQARPWDESLDAMAKVSSSGALSPTRRPDKFGLAGWGEDYVKWPSHRPCSNLGENEPPCGKFPSPMGDVWRPIKANGTRSLMVCDPDILDDLDARVVAMPAPAREAYFADPKQWGGHRRAMCRHHMFYEPLNAGVMLRYPRRFIAHWKDIEDRLRALLDSFIERGARAQGH